MRVVLDTNIYLSGLNFPESFPGKVLRLARSKKIRVYCSKFIIDELKKNLIVKFDYEVSMAEKFIEEILKFVLIVRAQKKVKIISKKDDDNRILECALAAKAEYLVTGDKKHILPLKEFRGVRIISAKEFISNYNKL